jgi:hypothetical protein
MTGARDDQLPLWRVPDTKHINAVFAEIDRLDGAEFLPEGRPEQPRMPVAPPLFESDLADDSALT